MMGRPTFNVLKVVVSTYHLAIKFLMPNEVGILRGNQERARKYYVEEANKICHQTPRLAIVSTIFKIDEIEPEQLARSL